MKFDWDPEKNEFLKKERNVSFEEIALLLSSGVLWKTIEHPNQERFGHQKAFLVPIDDHIYFVPYVMDGNTIFLKTAFAHRKATREYLKERNGND